MFSASILPFLIIMSEGEIWSFSSGSLPEVGLVPMFSRVTLVIESIIESRLTFLELIFTLSTLTGRVVLF